MGFFVHPGNRKPPGNKRKPDNIPASPTFQYWIKAATRASRYRSAEREQEVWDRLADHILDSLGDEPR